MRHGLDRLQTGDSRANGTRFGRPRQIANAEHIATATRMKGQGETAATICRTLAVGRTTLYRYSADDVPG